MELDKIAIEFFELLQIDKSNFSLEEVINKYNSALSFLYYDDDNYLLSIFIFGFGEVCQKLFFTEILDKNKMKKYIEDKYEFLLGKKNTNNYNYSASEVAFMRSFLITKKLSRENLLEFSKEMVSQMFDNCYYIEQLSEEKKEKRLVRKCTGI